MKEYGILDVIPEGLTSSADFKVEPHLKSDGVTNYSEAVIVGGGAAGLLCAAIAAGRGRKVLLLERMERPARKLMITGKGRCNLTNNSGRDEFIAAAGRGGRFLYSAYSAFSSQDTMELFRRLGVPLKTERGARVFPVSDKAVDVVDALVGFARKSGANILRERAERLIMEDGRVVGVRCERGNIYRAESVVVATGGKSYPLTGSTGDGYLLAEQAGHTIVPPRPSLVPLEIREKWCREAMGLSLKNVALTLTKNENSRAVYREQGEMLFTHFGVSGPLVLSASANINGDPAGYSIHIDLKPALSPEQLDARLLRDFSQSLNRDFSNSLDKLLPRKIIMPIVRMSGIRPETKINQITKEQRRSFATLIKDVVLHIERMRPIEEAVITCGGVKLSEVNPATMRSKMAEGLFFAGEVLDVDSVTGGFNLQIAFSTGYIAGMNI